MTETSLLHWFDEIEATIATRQQQAEQGKRLATDDATLLSDMESALSSAFPSSHAVRVRWESARKRALVSPHRDLPTPEVWFIEDFLGVFSSAHDQLRKGRLRGLIDGVRGETVGETLDVADSLCASNHVVAAVVIAGGALEVHLRHLCQRFNVTWPGHGSIQKYNDALSHARNTGAGTISAVDSQQVTAWGAKRNTAAHDPTTFQMKPEEARLMLEGIRLFVTRTQ